MWPGSSMSVTIAIWSLWRLAIRPVTTRPSLVAMTTASYWSLMALLGTTIDSSRSRVLNRPAIPERSGPTPPPSLSNRWQAKHLAAANITRPWSKSRPLRPPSTIGTSSSSVHFLTNFRSGPAAAEAVEAGFASMIGLSRAFSASSRWAIASRRMLAMKPGKLLPPLNGAALGNQEKNASRSAGCQPVFRTRRARAYSSCSSWVGARPSRATVFAAASGALEVGEHLDQLGVELAAGGRIVRVESLDQPGHGRESSGRPNRLRTTW